MRDGDFWADVWRVVQYAPAFINMLTLIVVMVMLLAALINSRR